MSSETSFSYDHTVDFYDHVVPYGARKDIEFYIALAEENKGSISSRGCLRSADGSSVGNRMR